MLTEEVDRRHVEEWAALSDVERIVCLNSDDSRVSFSQVLNACEGSPELAAAFDNYLRRLCNSYLESLDWRKLIDGCIVSANALFPELEALPKIPT
jgi:hypothetical protein